MFLNLIWLSQQKSLSFGETLAFVMGTLMNPVYCMCLINEKNNLIVTWSFYILIYELLENACSALCCQIDCNMAILSTYMPIMGGRLHYVQSFFNRTRLHLWKNKYLSLVCQVILLQKNVILPPCILGVLFKTMFLTPSLGRQEKYGGKSYICRTLNKQLEMTLKKKL